MIQKYNYHFTCMTTPCQIVLYADDRKLVDQVAREIEANTFRLEKKYNFFSDDSLIAEINHRSNQRVPIDQETRHVLLQVRELSTKTQGCFDITVGTLKQCLKLKTAAEVEACRRRLKKLIGSESWQIEGEHLCFANPQVQIDLGGVIKEYAVDQGAAIAKKEGLPALVNFGGDIFVNHIKPGGKPFQVAIKNPKKPDEQLAVIQLKNQGLTTSAHYERSSVIDGKRFSHIIGEQSGEINILSATVISNSVLMSGIFSTSLMLNPSMPVPNDLGLVLIDEELRLHQNILPRSKYKNEPRNL